ncbi:MAG: exodeoxyribonuclease VII small subunit [Planctomycetota bacterium]|nr:exodeoxyribonuclease VII small subunit [Planctomycetota bacterium]
MTKRSENKPAADASQPEPTFEQAVESLEQIIDRIESGEVGLEKSIREYERGMDLIRRCRTILDTAEQRVRELTIEDEATDSNDKQR